ncbi:uncharacterized protein LOC144354057 [Saccoglossus kowalevskii]
MEGYSLPRGKLVVLFFLSAVLTAKAADTVCPVDPDYSDGDTYICPEEDENNNINTYTECCYNDRPDADGNYYSCCQSQSEQDATKKERFKTIAIVVGASCGSVIVLVFLCCYCQSDTFKFVGRVKKRAKFWCDIILDSICFCTCCCKECRRSDKVDVEGASTNLSHQQRSEDVVITMGW